MKLLYKLFALTLVLAVMSVLVAQMAGSTGKQVRGAIKLQDRYDSTVKWAAPFTSAYKVHVFVPQAGTAANAIYRVYSKGKKAGGTSCDSTDANYPCFEVTVDQTRHPNMWVQLTLNGDVATQWDFVKGKGYVTAVVDNLSAAEMLNLSTPARFEDMGRMIGKTYQGGIIFYIDGTGEHGLIAAPTDQGGGFQWWNGSYITTGATGIAVGTGLDNTNQILTMQGSGGYAAQLCADLVIGLYGDWFLPSKDELNLMYQNIGPGAAAPLTNIGRFAGAWYWSSSENDNVSAWFQNFGSGFQFTNYKSNTFSVRAVRAF